MFNTLVSNTAYYAAFNLSVFEIIFEPVELGEDCRDAGEDKLFQETNILSGAPGAAKERMEIGYLQPRQIKYSYYNSVGTMPALCKQYFSLHLTSPVNWTSIIS